MVDKNLFDLLLKEIEANWSGLPDKPDETPDSTLRSLWLLAAGSPVSTERAIEEELPELSEGQIEKLISLVKVRLAGQPLAYMTGRQSFMGMEFIASPGAMIPRMETEILAKAVKQVLSRLTISKKIIHVLDLCTGSGNLALFMASEFPACRIIGADISADALEVARRNVDFHALNDRVEFVQSDLFGAVMDRDPQPRFDLITCNPPYISSANVEKMPGEISKHEPRQAFDGGPFGFNLPWRLAKEAPQFMDTDGWLCFEIGLGQGKQMHSTLVKNPAYRNIETHFDKNGEIRAFSVQAARQ